MIKVINSSFLYSTDNLKNTRSSIMTEMAILGRSNVGKSSLINLILNQRLAKSSSTPGKTKLINFFKTTFKDNDKNIDISIVDFPGFGYAKTSKEIKKDWDKNLSEVLIKRQNIRLFCHLIDSRHTNLEIDSKIENFLESIKNERKIIKIYTKVDKLSKNEFHELKKQKKILISNKQNDLKEKLLESILLNIF